MLYLTRKKGERIYVGGATITVVRTELVRGVPQVKLGIDAPKNVSILREELRDGEKANEQ